MHAAAIACWAASWCALSVGAAGVWAAGRGHKRALIVTLAAAIAATVLTWTGAVLW